MTTKLDPKFTSLLSDTAAKLQSLDVLPRVHADAAEALLATASELARQLNEFAVQLFEAQEAKIAADEEIAVATQNKDRQVLVAQRNKERTDAVEVERVTRDRDLEIIERQRITSLVIMCFVVMFFWMAFHQNGTTLTFWARDNTDRMLRVGSWSWEIPPGVFQAFNSVFVIVLTPVLVRFMTWLRSKNMEPSTPAKLGIGMLLTGAAYGIMVLASWAGGNSGKVSMLWLIASYFVVTVAELHLSPMGLSMVTKLAPRRMTAMLMGVWFISTAVGNYLSGFLGRFWKPWKHSDFFALLVATSLIAAVLLVSQYRRLKAAMPHEGPPEEPKSNVVPASEVAAVPEAGY